MSVDEKKMGVFIKYANEKIDAYLEKKKLPNSGLANNLLAEVYSYNAVKDKNSEEAAKRLARVAILSYKILGLHVLCQQDKGGEKGGNNIPEDKNKKGPGK